ncbi:MAG: hypothetical protein COX17_03550 [Deltaproteobacteria bacterium CG23_combo_of_CG06-09_8_20_14_all_60_8]|nr:MAG: hypothetical protein AUK28_10195 [Desulfobacterales bacterium CG2_30_60_27]PIP44073.1 MAG: hypothetical protein COX17_03550 [Deltaproteobacteria bacterium CG23_combo_of_CG06-09_8_20_14_all_60_8]
MALMQITVIPLGLASSSVGEYVADIELFLQKAGVACQLNDMGTVIQGKAAELFGLAARIHELPFNKGVRRVVTQIVLDDRRDQAVAIGDKVAAVRARLALAK